MAVKGQWLLILRVLKKEVAPVSLMPPGLTSMLRKDEFLDLVRFLSELGKEGKYKVPAGRFARRWRVIPAKSGLSFGSCGEAEDRAVTEKEQSVAMESLPSAWCQGNYRFPQWGFTGELIRP